MPDTDGQFGVNLARKKVAMAREVTDYESVIRSLASAVIRRAIEDLSLGSNSKKPGIAEPSVYPTEVVSAFEFLFSDNSGGALELWAQCIDESPRRIRAAVIRHFESESECVAIPGHVSAQLAEKRRQSARVTLARIRKLRGLSSQLDGER